MSAHFIPETWPESEAEEEKLDAQVEAEFPFDDKVVAMFVGESVPNAGHVRVRMFRELAGWTAFEHIVTDLLAGAVLLVTWSLIACFQVRTIYLLGLAFVAVQVIHGIRFSQVRGVAKYLADLLPAGQEYEKPTWIMFVRTLEQIATELYRIRARA